MCQCYFFIVRSFLPITDNFESGDVSSWVMTCYSIFTVELEHHLPYISSNGVIIEFCIFCGPIPVSFLHKHWIVQEQKLFLHVNPSSPTLLRPYINKWKVSQQMLSYNLVFSLVFFLIIVDRFLGNWNGKWK